MGLEFDLDGNIIYRGEKVGNFRQEDGRSVVRINLEYATDGEEPLGPIVWLAHGLAQLPENQPSDASLVFESEQEDLEAPISGPALLVEKQIKIKGHNWVFHKADTDFWPSALHGHEYSYNLKIDALTGDIYNATSRKLVGKIKGQRLAELHLKLRESKDFSDRVAQLIDGNINQ